MTGARTAAELRHELRTPLNAVLGYSAMLLEDLGESGGSAVATLGNIRAAGQELLDRVDQLFGSGGTGADGWRAGSHDLRTPLSAVLGYAELLQEEPDLPGELAEDAGRIVTAAHTMLSRIDQLDRDGLPVPPPEAVLPGAATTVREPQPPAAVLVVDDNPLNRDLLGRRLTRLGHTVTLAEDGERALALLDERPTGFDLVLLDVVMPGIDGYAVLGVLRERGLLPHLPVLVLSALDDSTAVIRCLNAGATDYVAKPFDPAVLAARVGACLEGKRHRDAEARHLAQVERERARADGLLRVLLPDAIADELTDTAAVAPRRHDGVAVLFADVAGFTSFCDARDPEEVLDHLQRLVERFEEIALAHGVQKIKTIGDAFLAVAGVPEPVDEPVLVAARCGLDMVAAARELPGIDWSVRVGIHTGPVVAGILGRRQYGYDVWGDTVNTAARVEHHGVVDAVALSRAAWDRLGERAVGRSLGVVPARGKQGLEVLELTALRPDGSAASAERACRGLTPNAARNSRLKCAGRGNPTAAAISAIVRPCCSGSVSSSWAWRRRAARITPATPPPPTAGPLSAPIARASYRLRRDTCCAAATASGESVGSPRCSSM